jgi:hypothetical protein
MLLSGLFNIVAIDSEGKKYKNVSRLEAKDETQDLELVADYHAILYPIHLRETHEITFWSEDAKGQKQNEDMTLTGKCFKLELHPNGGVEAIISCGGLLVSIKGKASALKKFELNRTVFISFKKR